MGVSQSRHAAPLRDELASGWGRMGASQGRHAVPPSDEPAPGWGRGHHAAPSCDEPTPGWERVGASQDRHATPPSDEPAQGWGRMGASQSRHAAPPSSGELALGWGRTGASQGRHAAPQCDEPAPEWGRVGVAQGRHAAPPCDEPAPGWGRMSASQGRHAAPPCDEPAPGWGRVGASQGRHAAPPSDEPASGWGRLGPAAAGITRSGQAFLDAQIAHMQCVVAAAVPVRTLDVKRGAWREWEIFCAAAGVEPVRTRGDGDVTLRLTEAATERDLQLALLVWALGRVKLCSKDDNEGKPATALCKVLAVRRVHARAGMPMVQCRALAHTVKALERSHIERNGTPQYPVLGNLKAVVLTMFYQGFRGDDVLVSAARPFTRASLARAGLEWLPPSLDRHAARPAHAGSDVGFMPRGEGTGDALDAAEALKLMRYSKHILRIGAATSLLADGQSSNSERANALSALASALSLEEIDSNADLYEVDE
ncbi:hypothetical protein T492DRAFT_862105 [Pavlovales sp. CCMP2436]|nr:hypothetical protein T492DRAFT_862105 [Pavlovales sp. CCMP2436]